MHRGFENKFGKLNIQELSPTRKPELKLKFTESSQTLSFRKRRDSEASSDMIRKSTSFRGKLLRSVTGLIKAPADEVNPKLKSSFTQLFGYFLADAFACIGHNAVHGKRTALGELKPLFSEMEQQSRDSFLDSEYSLTSSKAGEDTSPSRASKVTF